MNNLKREKTEKLLLLYIIFRQELQLKCKKDNKVASERQLHEYAFNKIIEEEVI